MPAFALSGMASASPTTRQDYIYSDEYYASLYRKTPEARRIAKVQGPAARDAFVAKLMKQREKAAKKSVFRAETHAEFLKSIHGRSRLRKVIARLNMRLCRILNDVL